MEPVAPEGDRNADPGGIVGAAEEEEIKRRGGYRQ